MEVQGGDVEVLNSTESDVHVAIEQIQNNYFECSNSLARHVISEQKALMKYLDNSWQNLDAKRRDALLDLLFVDEVREQYNNKLSLTADQHHYGSTEDIPESFPTLYIDSGQKIHCDFENDLWTWRDEHSGPFSWMSRSQQDLTLVDLEPENITKPQSKSLRGEPDPNRINKLAEEQFTYPVNSWSRDIIDGFSKHEKEIVITPSPSGFFSPNSTSTSPEAENAKEDTDVPVMNEMIRTSKESDSERLPDDSKDVKERRRRSPSPKKIIRASSLRRSPSKVSDQGQQKLIATDKSEEAYEERNTFSNPLMETQWSNFIGNETDTDAPIDPNAGANLPNEPVIQIMDRGRGVPGSSPYQGDRVQLISPSDSPSQASGISAHLASPGLSSWSAESTPDHSTHLLKGMQKEEKPPAPFLDLKPVEQDQESNLEEDEMLTVEKNGDDVKIVSGPESKTEENDDNVPTTGFDFLDNW